MNININNDILFVNENKVEFTCPVKNTFEYENNLIVILKKPLNKTFNERIFSVSPNGKILWQIQPATKGIKTSDETQKIYIDCYINEKNQLIARTFYGDEYLLNPQDVTVEYLRFTK